MLRKNKSDTVRVPRFEKDHPDHTFFWLCL